MAGFMQLDGLTGDSKNQAFTGFIRIDSMSSEITREIPESARGNQRAKGHTLLNNISVTRQLDASSTELQRFVSIGKVIPKATVVFANMYGDSGKYQPYLKYELENVVLASYSISCDSDGEDLPKEELTLSYTKVEWSYTPYDEKGAQSASVTHNYDLTTDSAG